MASNLDIDDALLTEALNIGGFKSKKETVNQALKEFIQRRRANEIINRFGTIDYDPNYDYKAGRM
jgi:Arc/MetJ family transcription regulator